MDHTTTDMQSAPATNISPIPAVWRWGAVWVTLLLLGMYLLVNGGQTFISDGELMLLSASRLVDYQSLRLPESATAFPQTVRGHSDYVYSRYGAGQPLLGAGLYAFGTYIVGFGLLPESNPYTIGRFFVLLLPPIATAITGGIVFLWAAQLYQSTGQGVLLALLFGLGTLALPYSRFFFSEPLFTCCLALAGFGIYRGWSLPAGGALGYALAIRISGVFLLPVFAIYTWLTGATLRQRLRRLIWLGVGLIPGVFLVFLNNWIRFRSLLERGYEGEGFTGNVFEGIAGLLVSPGKSLFLYVPLLLALPFAIRPFTRSFPNESLFIGLLSVSLLLQSAFWWIWWGGWGWGPRFLVPLMPFLVLMLGVLLTKRHWQIIILGILLPLSLLINTLGIVVDFNSYLSEISRGLLEREQIYLWQPGASPILAHLERFDLANVPIISFQLSRSDIGFPEPLATILSGLTVALVIGATVGLWQTVRRAKRIALG